MDPNFWRIFHAHNEQDAAEQFCKSQDSYNNADYVYANNGEAEILVRPDAKTNPVKVYVRVEMIAEYTGRLL
jgi:hypothetical protein